MPVTKRKDQNPFGPDDVVRATRTFAWEGGVVHQGERLRGNDPAVDAGWSAFVSGDTLDHELENMWEQMPEPPSHAPPVTVQSITIPVHRQVVCHVDVSRQMQWAPDSPGARSDGTPPFAITELRRGQILDVLDERVSVHPEWFRWIERDVSHDDVERFHRFESE